MGFFNDLSKKATETYKTTTDKTSKKAKELRLKSYINECKKKIDDIYNEIGKRVYEKHILGEGINIDEDLKDEIERIDTITERMESMKNEILSLKDLKVCEKCATEIGLDAKFCPKCGAKQEEIEIVPSSEAIKAEEAVQVNEDVPTASENVIENGTANAEAVINEEILDEKANEDITENE